MLEIFIIVYGIFYSLLVLYMLSGTFLLYDEFIVIFTLTWDMTTCATFKDLYGRQHMARFDLPRLCPRNYVHPRSEHSPL